jgi:hypothetical protein
MRGLPQGIIPDILYLFWERRDRHRMVIGFTNTCAISASILDTTLCDKVCQ